MLTGSSANATWDHFLVVPCRHNSTTHACHAGLVPCRFLTMVSHLVLLLTILLARDDYVEACLPFDYEEDEFGRKDVELVRN